jgi:prepilin-type N-terminal cleavage/methylation domain-containing protein
MMTRFRRQARGFTLIELLVVIAIIGLISAILLPNLLDALQKAKQKRTVATIRDVGTAWFSWMTDELSSAAAGANQFNFDALTPISAANLRSSLIPEEGARYAASVPRTDHWANPLDYVAAEKLKAAPSGIAVRSRGRDGEAGPTEPPYPIGSFPVTQYDQDIVWSDGFFVRYPAGVRTSSD